MSKIIAVRTWCVVSLTCLFTVHFGLAQQTEDRMADPYHGSLTNEVRRILDQDQPVSDLQQYIVKNNIPTQQVVDVLKWFANTPKEGAGLHWSEQAITVMGRLRYNSCSTYLEQLALQSGEKRRFSLVRAIIRIGGSNAVEFATSALSNTNFSRTDRRYLYEDVIRHSLSALFEDNIISRPSSEEKVLMMGFLCREPRCSEKMDAVFQNDESWSRYSVYATNEERVVFLTYFSTNAPAQYQQEFIRRLGNLSSLQPSPGAGKPGPVVPVDLSTTQTMREKRLSIVSNRASVEPTLLRDKLKHKSFLWFFVALGLGGVAVFAFAWVADKNGSRSK